jgi:y4mF family transcriptional regulator
MNTHHPISSPATIGQTIRTVRRAQKLTQVDLALAAGVSTPFLSALENGKSTVRLDVLLRVLDALNIRMELSVPEGLAGESRSNQAPS